MTSAAPTRGRQARATKAEVTNAWRRIRDAAEDGSLLGSALLIALSEGKPFAHADGGILNLPGHGGWVGDPADPGETIRAAIQAGTTTRGGDQ
ncbi:hypothetical protein [Halopseudomonas aestusnigri]|uniref:Uncharacterized protein n=1 Tax=Halopseudomonas aestusnigri TaxID=857252 RepID=A0AAQ1JQ43_9GAMM|nr:hypothetical protein [Halopseudomonas aestusnigri]OWL88851.1 hypothetical protein B7O88_09315 [Halopseudomonas aestusnigri]SEG35117.1 hypothetical protein SAMN05216586_105165 [Halopseudomonas aestusnigri]